MIGLKELLEMKEKFEHEKIFVEAKIEVVNQMIETEKEKEVEQTEINAIV